MILSRKSSTKRSPIKRRKYKSSSSRKAQIRGHSNRAEHFRNLNFVSQNGYALEEGDKPSDIFHLAIEEDEDNLCDLAPGYISSQMHSEDKESTRICSTPFKLPLLRENISNCFIDRTIDIDIGPKLLPFFHNALFENEMWDSVDKSSINLNSFSKAKKEIQLKVLIFSSTKTVSGMDTLKKKLKALHPEKEPVFYEISLVNYESPIKMIIWFRISLRMLKKDHERFVSEVMEKNKSIDTNLATKVSFSNQVNVEARRDFAQMSQDIKELEVQFLQNAQKLNYQQQSEKLAEINKYSSVKNILSDCVVIPEVGLAMKSYITFLNPHEVETRLDFKFPTTSLSSFALNLNDLKLI